MSVWVCLCGSVCVCVCVPVWVSVYHFNIIACQKSSMESIFVEWLKVLVGVRRYTATHVVVCSVQCHATVFLKRQP